MQSAGPQPLARRQFASDNYAGIAPEAWAALEAANHGHAPPYGEDTWTTRAAELIRELFETDCRVFSTFGGTAANSLALAALCRSYQSIVCHEVAHIETDECGGPGFFAGGATMVIVGGEGGKVDARELEQAALRRGDVHSPKPAVLSLTQATEMGTVYRPDELISIVGTARRLGLRVHMDGARFASAVATLGVAPKDLTWKAGVDVLCLGGTKLGMLAGEAVVFFTPELADEFDARSKQAGQLASKMRFLTASWVGMLASGAWLRHAAHANRMARLLAEKLAHIGGVTLVAPTEANAVFADLSQEVADRIRSRGWQFLTFGGESRARFMCSWDTTESDVERLAADMASAAPAV